LGFVPRDVGHANLPAQKTNLTGRPLYSNPEVRRRTMTLDEAKIDVGNLFTLDKVMAVVVSFRADGDINTVQERLHAYALGAGIHSEIAGSYCHEKKSRESEITLRIWPPHIKNFCKFCCYFGLTLDFVCFNEHDYEALTKLGHRVELKQKK